MAIGFPEDIEIYNPVQSERDVFYALKKQLPDRCSIFHHIRWMNDNGKKSEVDFLVFDPHYGFIVLEVKGGSGVSVENDRWTIHSDYGPITKGSPYDQAQDNMYEIVRQYERKYNQDFTGFFGYAVVFPFYRVPNADVLSNRPKECTIDSSSMNNLEDRMKNLFLLNSKGKRPRLSEDMKDKFINLLEKKIALSAAAGALIEVMRAQLENINRVQDNLIYFIQNYNQFFIKGGAGTGKTWIAIKMARQQQVGEKKVLFLCSHGPLRDYIRANMGNDKVEISTTSDWIAARSLPKGDSSTGSVDGFSKAMEARGRRYDTIIVDEAQDVSEEMATSIRQALRDGEKSHLYIFFDETQNVYNRRFGDAFAIKSPPFILRENLRNTAKIYEYATSTTSLGKEVLVNKVSGPKPEQFSEPGVPQLRSRLERILDDLIRLEGVRASSVVVLIDKKLLASIMPDNTLASWRFVTKPTDLESDIRTSTVEEYKGMESDVVIYIHTKESSNILSYVAYTRARFYLSDITINLKN